MEKIDILLCPPVAFLIFLVAIVVFYILIGRISLKADKNKDKISTYACGEDMPGFKFQFGYSLFFIFALFFTMMHVATLVIATLPAKTPQVYFGLFYLATIFLSVLGLIMYRNDPENQFVDKDEEND